jgi:hypothetical protein
MLALTPVEDFGLAPYKVQGDPFVALLAQLNRFAGEKVKIGNCDKEVYVEKPYPLHRDSVDDASAGAALRIINQRYACAPSGLTAQNEWTWARKGLDNPLAFLKWNLDQITLIIAQVGDIAGFDAAEVGITTRDPRHAKKFPTGSVIAIGLLLAAIGGATYYQRRKK